MTALYALLMIGAAEVKADDADGVVTFTIGDEVIAAYRHRGVVKEEKGASTKPLAKPCFFPLNAPGGLLMKNGSSLSGEGVVDAPVTNSNGMVTASGAGLVFKKAVTRTANGAGSGMGGTRLTFDSSASFTGLGSMS